MYTIAEIKELMNMGFTPEQISRMGESGGKPARKAPGKVQPTAEQVPFVKKDGTTVMATPAQAKAWEAWRSAEHKSLDEVKAEYAEKREGYKPSEALVEAIKANRAAITRKVAVETYGFIGTKEDLRNLKDSICK